MVEINNQRKAFLDMLAWSEGTDNGHSENQKSWLWRSWASCYWLLRSPSQTCHAKPKANQQAPDATSFFPVGGMPTASNGLKDFSPKVRTLWHCSRLRSVALYLWLIVVISVRQSTVATISGLHCRALVMVSSSIRLTAWLQNSKKRAERSEIDARAESPRLSPLWLSTSSSACHGLLIITVITPLPTKPSATKMPENWSWRANGADMQMRRRCCCARCKKNTRRLADTLNWKWCSAWWCCRWSSSVLSKPLSAQSVREATTASGVDVQPPPDWRVPLNGIISPSERGWSLCKNNWKEPRSILMSSADRVAHIDGQLMQLLWAIHTRFQRSINA